MAYLVKDSSTILNEVLKSITANTPVTATSPGSVVRAIVEAMSTELADFYTILDFNMNLQTISTAQGRQLDLIGSMYNVVRKTLSSPATIDQSTGTFYFYLNAPYTQDIVIPAGILVTTNPNSILGDLYTYYTAQQVILPAGRTRVYVSITPANNNSVFAAGANTLTSCTIPNLPPGVVVNCTNPKPIPVSVGYEDDASYRTRIQLGVRQLAGSTALAVRLTALSVSGVRDVTIRQTPYGLGTYEVLVVPEDPSVAAVTVANATAALTATAPVGSRMYISEPDYLPVDVKCSIVVATGAQVDTSTLATRVQNSIIRFLNTPLVGSQLIYNGLIQAIMDTDDNISDVVITYLAVNGSEVLRRNYVPQGNEQIIPGNVTVSIQV